MKVTRQVISDLWPLYAAGEASADTRTLVDAFLAGDPQFAETLKAAPALPAPDLRTAPGAEVAALKRTRDLVYGRSWLRALRLVALVLTVFAVKRAINEVQWSTTPALFIGEAITAIVLWTAYVLLVRHYRVQSLRMPRSTR
jgi:hypothetical protein